MTRIVLDTNIWIKFLITNDYSKLDPVLSSGQVKLLFSEELLAEFLDVTSRPKFKKYFLKSNIDAILDIIEDHAEFIRVKSKVNICRDPKDNFLLSLSSDGKADYLITGDKDLLVLKKAGKTKIVTISAYLEKF